MEKTMFSKMNKTFFACLRHLDLLHKNTLYNESPGESSKKVKKTQIITGIRDLVFKIENTFFNLKNRRRRMEVSYGYC